MREKVLRFGVERGLTGILAEPAERRDGGPGVVLLNSGILHHVGPSRIYVDLARNLAAEGLITLRFDYSGIGDSEPRKDSLPFVQSAPVETQAAMDLLQKKFGLEDFWLIGLCSGADMAFKVAGLDERVTAIIQLDPYAYRTRSYYVRRYGPKLLNPMSYVRSVQGRRRNAQVAKERESEEHQETYTAPEYRRIFPPREEVEAQLDALLKRDVRMLNIFSDGQSEHINHGAQYAAAFPDLDFRDRLTVEYISHAEHTFTDLGDQERIQAAVVSWARNALDSDSATVERPAAQGAA